LSARSTRLKLPELAQLAEGLEESIKAEKTYCEALVGRINDGPAKAYVLRLSPALQGRVSGATGEKVQLELAGGATTEATWSSIPADAFDCMILTQTYHVIYDIRAAIAQTCRALQPGGVLLATLPGISQISRYDMDRWGDYWRFTTLSAQRLFEEAFGAGQVTVESHGNVLLATAFLQGMACEDLPENAFTSNDPDYQVMLTVRAVKPGAGG
jgi:SAM-dependent methyltransferase